MFCHVSKVFMYRFRAKMILKIVLFSKNNIKYEFRFLNKLNQPMLNLNILHVEPIIISCFIILGECFADSDV